MFIRLTSCLIIACASTLSAQESTTPYHEGRFYVAGTAGYFMNYDIESNPQTTGGHFEFEFDGDIAYTGAVGWHIAGMRTEFELGFSESELNQINPSAPTFNDSGDLSTTTFMINVFIDQPIIRGKLDGYIGGGIGAAYIKADFDYAPSFSFDSDGGPITVNELNEEAWVVASQFMAGLAFHISDNVTLTTGYRLQLIDGNEFDNLQIFENRVIHQADIGLRFTF